MLNQLIEKIDNKLERLEGLGMSTSTAIISIDRLIYDILAINITEELGIELPSSISIKQLNTNEWGQYDQDTDTVVMNVLLSPTSYVLTDDIDTAMNHISTLAHELRHKYQRDKNNSILDNYVQPEDNMDEYKAHPSEVDAREYQQQWITNNKDMIIDKLIKEL